VRCVLSFADDNHLRIRFDKSYHFLMLASDSNQSTYNEAVSATHKVDMNGIKKLYKMGLASSNHTQYTPEAAGG